MGAHVLDRFARRLVPHSDFTTIVSIYGVEGPGGWFAAPDAPAEGSDERERMLWAARQVETEPTLIRASALLLAMARNRG